MSRSKWTVGPIVSVCILPIIALGSAVAQNACADGDAALAQGHWDAAHRSYQICAQANPTFAVYSNMGIALSHLGRMDEAISSYEQALKLDPTNTRIEFNLAVALIKAGNYLSAADHLKRLQRTPNDVRNEELLAFCYYHLASYSLAARAAEHVYALDPDDPANALILGSTYTRMGQYDKALPLITFALKAAGSAEGHLILGQTLTGLHQFDPAEAELKQVAAENPDFPALHEALGEVYVGTFREPLAEAEFALAIKQAPDDFEANYFLGRLKRFDGDISAATRYLDAAAKLRPDSPEVAYERGEIAMKERRFNDAVPLLEAAIKGEPDEPQAYLLLSEAYQRVGRKADAQREGELYSAKRRDSRKQVQEKQQP